MLVAGESSSGGLRAQGERNGKASSSTKMVSIIIIVLGLHVAMLLHVAHENCEIMRSKPASCLGSRIRRMRTK